MSIEAMKQALEALEDVYANGLEGLTKAPMEALRQAIEQAENASAVAWLVERAMCEPLIQMCKPKDGNYLSCEPLYTHPSTRKPLTDEQIDDLELPPSGCNFRDIVRVIERAHGIGGEA